MKMMKLYINHYLNFSCKYWSGVKSVLSIPQELSKKHRHFKTLSVSVSDTLWTLLHACPHCIGRGKKYLFN